MNYSQQSIDMNGSAAYDSPALLPANMPMMTDAYYAAEGPVVPVPYIREPVSMLALIRIFSYPLTIVGLPPLCTNKGSPTSSRQTFYLANLT